MENDYEKRYYEKEELLRNASFKDSYLFNDLINKAKFNIKNLDNPAEREQVSYNLDLLNKEIRKEYKYRKRLAKEQSGIPLDYLQVVDHLNIEEVNPDILNSCLNYLQSTQKFYSDLYKYVYNKLNDQTREEDQEYVQELKRKNHNETLEEFVTNKNEFLRIIEFDGELLQKKDPIYLDPENSFIKAHFYDPRKAVFGRFFPTIWVNLGVMWMSTIMLYLALYFRLLKRFLDFLENLSFSKK